MSSILEALWVRGACARVSTSGWSGTLTLSPEDLGLLPEDVDANLIQVGRGWLTSKESLARLNSFREAARHLRDGLSVPFVISDLYYVPVGNMASLEQGISSLKDKLDRAVAEFASGWKHQREQTLDRWREWLGQSYARIPWATLPEDRRATQDDFVARGLARVQAALPTEARLRRAWSIDLCFLQLDVPRGLTSSVVSAAEAGAKLIAFERQRETWEREVEGFVASTTKALRARVAEVADRVADFASRGELKAQSVTALGKVLDEVRALNFIGDPGLTAAIDELAKVRPQLDSAASLRDEELLQRLGGAVGGVAQAIRTGTAKAAEDAVEGFGRSGKRAVRL